MTAVLHRQSVETEALWTQYRVNGDPEAREELLSRYVGLVYHVARSMARRAPAADSADLVSAGMIGLVRALDSFDLSRGLAFSTYAVRRIRGAMLDDLRSTDWAPRSVRSKHRRLNAAVTELQHRLGREPRAKEVAAELGVSLSEYWEWRDGSAGRAVVSFDAEATAQRGSLTFADVIDDPDAPAPDHELSEDERADGLKAAIAKLAEKERTVLALYYYEELTLRQIAEVLHVTESRVSQIRTKALRRLRDRLGDRERL